MADLHPKRKTPFSPHPGYRINSTQARQKGAFASLSQSQTGNDVSISFQILFLQIIEQPSPLSDQLQQTPSGMMVFFVRLEMLRQVFDPGAQKSDLDLGRTRIVLMKFEVADYRSSLFNI
jgi:hypothetical protein